MARCRVDSRPAPSAHAPFLRHREFPLNDHKNPATPDRAVTVLTLAIELSTTTRTLLNLAREMRLPIWDDEDPLTDDDVDRLRTLYSMTSGRMPTHQSAEIIPGFTPRHHLRNVG